MRFWKWTAWGVVLGTAVLIFLDASRHEWGMIGLDVLWMAIAWLIILGIAKNEQAGRP